VQRPTGIGARTVFIALAAAALAVMLPVASAAAVERVIKTTGPVISLSCAPCHADISDTKIPGIKFSHAAHILYECAACHSKFPHQPEGTTIPTMKDCWNCHALRHGPQGIMAASECNGKCHLPATTKRRPKDHVADWKNKPHVQPGAQQLRTRCMMCHDQKGCVDCHDKLKIYWDPKVPYSFDPGNGCLACHGGNLPRLKGPVVGIDASAHRDTTCLECHPDFKYTDAKDATKLWQVNAGIACRSCHLTLKQTAKKTASIKAYDASIHAKRIKEGNLKSATCASCHGGHDIERLKTPAALRRIRLSGEKMCADCHAAAWSSYNDYWHGAAYKAGALDAPACWDCHDGPHATLPVKDPKSQASPEKLGDACGQSGCHEGSNSDFAEANRTLVHGQVKMKDDNPLIKLFGTVFGRK
jgi:hypothetical protein